MCSPLPSEAMQHKLQKSHSWNFCTVPKQGVSIEMVLHLDPLNNKEQLVFCMQEIYETMYQPGAVLHRANNVNRCCS